MKKKFLFLLPLLSGLLYIGLSSSSGGAAGSSGVERTGATGTSGCGGCHGSSATSAINVSLTLDSAGVTVTRYVAGQTYNIIITGTQTSSSFSLANFGFQLSAVLLTGAGTSSASNAGTLATTGLPAGCVNRSISGIRVIEHSTPLSGSGGGGAGTVYTRSIAWTAPATTGTGTIRLYGVINAINSSGGADGGDKWNTTSTTITELVPTVAPITGSTSVCQGSSTTLSCATTGGTWGSGTTSVATVSSTGEVFGVSPGTSVISYVTGIGTATVTATVRPLPGVISGTTSVCIGGTTALSDTPSGGTWTSGAVSVATITSGTGLAHGVSAGTAPITYTTSFGCQRSTTLTVHPDASVGSITGPTIVCIGDTIALSDTPSGGTWSTPTTSIATVSSSGRVVGLSAGTAFISYTVLSAFGCGSAVAAHTVTVDPAPAAGVITGDTALCFGSIGSLTSSGDAGGTWASSDESVLLVDASGAITSLLPGTSVVTYSVTASCGSRTSSRTVSVENFPDPGVISGASELCLGSPLAYTSSEAGGVWSSDDTSIVAVSDTGLATPRAVGSTFIRYTVTNSCGSNSSVLPVNISTASAGTVTGEDTICAGSTTTLTSSSTGVTWTTSDPFIATVDFTSGEVSGVAPGSTIITALSTGACGIDTTEFGITVIGAPTAGTLSGAATVCASSTITLTPTISGGSWFVTNGNASVSSAGVVTGTTAGVDTILYVVSGTCGNDTATHVVTINPTASAGTISGAASVCEGATTTLSSSVTGGSWTSGSTSIATVNISSGVVSGVSGGTVTITYSVTGCGSAFTTRDITVNPLPLAGAITGASSVCIAASTTMANSTATGTGSWSVTPVSIATINAAGVVTGISDGPATISYTATNSCGTAVATLPFTVNPLPDAGTISGPSTVCSGSTVTLTPSISGGGWSSTSTTVATVSGTGVVLGVGSGTATISYTITTGCGTAAATHIITTDTPYVAGTISGASSVCEGASTTLTYSAGGGSWVSGNTSIATVSSSGVVTGVAAGSTTISYIFTNSCGTTNVTHAFTVNALPVPGTISGSTSICIGSPVTLSVTGTGGTWSSSAPGIATVDASGLVTGISTGPATISYSVTNGCGTVSATRNVTINLGPDAGTITGPTSVCQGSTITLSSTATGGTWSSSATGTATISSGGVVSGVSSGSVTISYIVNNGCGFDTATYNVTVNPLPVPGTLSGAASVCPSATTALTLTGASAGGTWSSTSTATATVSSSGVVTGVAAGTAVISYTVTNGCGTLASTHNITVNAPTNAGTITGPTSVCVSGTIALSNGVSGGTWSSATTSVATISSSGIVTGMSAGTSVISYSVTGTCGTAVATYTVTVNPAASAGTISGSSTVCTGSSVSLSSTVSGGTWATSNAAIATVNTSGLVTGLATGGVTISYTVTTACGTAVGTYPLTVITVPSAGTISGPVSNCVGAVIGLSATATGGTWSSSASGIAAVDGAGNVTGTGVGTAVISYTVTNACGSASATHTVNISLLPDAGTITGSSSVCAGFTTTLANSVSGGVWSSTSTGIATIGTSGVVLGVSGGTTTISYTVTSACGTSAATFPLTVVPLPSAGTLSGASSVCEGGTTTLASTASGGTWSSSTAAVATVGSATGVVSGVSAGTTIITYSVSNSCGTSIATRTITVSPLPSPGTISGLTRMCVGTVTTYTSSVTGGVWSVTNAAATITATGVLTAVSAGIDTVLYSVTNTCGTVSASLIDTIYPNSLSGIVGDDTLCIGDTVYLSAPATGGVWLSSNTNATVFPDGMVVGLAAGADTISYTIVNICGTFTASVRMVIQDCTAGVDPATPTLARVALYPNPNSGTFTVDIPVAYPQATVTIMDVTGRVIEARVINNATGNKHEFNLAGKAAGSYMIKVDAGNETFREKVIVW